MTVVFKVIKAPTDGRRCRSPAQHKLKNYKPITTPPPQKDTVSPLKLLRVEPPL